MKKFLLTFLWLLPATAHYQLQLKDAAPRLEVRMAAIRFLEFRR